jgi:hypothetical protein
MAPAPDSDDSEDETRKRPTRQAYRYFNEPPERERQMLILALRGELTSREPKFLKQTLNKHASSRILKILQDEDISLEKLISQAAKAFSLNWVKQNKGKLQYKQQFFSKYAPILEKPTGIPTKIRQPTKIKQPLIKPAPAPKITPPPALTPTTLTPTPAPAPTPAPTQDPSDHDNDSENLLSPSEEEEKDLAVGEENKKASADDDLPADDNLPANDDLPDPHTLPSRPFAHHIWEGHRSDRRTVRTSDAAVRTSNAEVRTTDAAASIPPRMKTPHLHHDLDSYSIEEKTSSSQEEWKQDIETQLRNATQIFNREKTESWRQGLETNLKTTLNNAITNFKEELLETLSTTKGELLTQLDTLRVDMTQQAQEIDIRALRAEETYQKLQDQQERMLLLQQQMDQQIASTQSFMTKAETFAIAFQQNAIKERSEIQAKREEHRKGFKFTMEQAARNQLALHEQKCDTAFTQARAKQTETFRQTCRDLQKDYKQRIITKYDTLENESMQFADQAALDLSDVLHQVLQDEKNNILQEISPEKILAAIKQDISTQLATSTATHLDAIKAQRKTVITQIQKTAKRTTAQFEQQSTEIRTSIKNGQGTLQATTALEMKTFKADIAALKPMMITTAIADELNNIKNQASIDFSLDLDSKVQHQLIDFTTQLKTKVDVQTATQQRTTPQRQYLPPDPNDPTHSIPATPDRTPMVNRFKLASSKGLEDRLPKFRRDDLYVHLPPDPAQHYMEAFYETLATNMQNFDYPIITLQDLAPRGSTCPDSAYEKYEHDTIKKIGRALYQKLLGVIPPTCTILHNLLANHSATQDGYRALYAMMRLKCAYLQDLLPTWGPNWPIGTTAFEYVSTLQSYLTQDRRRNKTYTEFEIAAEMVQQAKQHPEYQLLAGAYMAQLIALPADTEHMQPEFLHENLALNFESNRQTTTIPATPNINKFGQRGGERGGGGNSDRKAGGRHQYKNPVQCASCRLFGHCIDSQVCRFSAQLVFAKTYINGNPEKAKTNADAYNAANNKTTVNKIYQQFPEKFHDDMTEEERETQRYEMATTFYSPVTNEDVSTADP